MGLDEEQIKELFSSISIDLGMGMLTGKPFEDLVGYAQDLQEGMGKLGGGDFGISSLERELRLLEGEVTGPGGLTQKKGTMADMLGKSISRKRNEYVPMEKRSRYSGGADPTSSYESSVYSAMGKYGEGIGKIDKSISDILYGTGEGSIHDVYRDYGEGVERSLFGDSGIWYGG